MKKFYLLTAAALLTAGMVTACSKASADADKEVSVENNDVLDGDDTGVEADIDAGYDPAEADDAAGVATMDDRAAVAILSNDNQFRPGQKVNRLTVLDFNATWCGPCKQFAPAFDTAAEMLGQQVDFYSVDIDYNPQTASAFGVESIPTVIFIRPDGSMKKYVGTGDLLPVDKFLELVITYLK